MKFKLLDIIIDRDKPFLKGVGYETIAVNVDAIRAVKGNPHNDTESIVYLNDKDSTWFTVQMPFDDLVEYLHNDKLYT